MTEIRAFEATTIERKPSTTFYKDGTYRSDRDYVDASGARWKYVGILNGDPLWSRGSEPACWNINTVVDQFGPLTEASEPAARLAEITARAEAATTGPWCTDDWEIYQGTEYQPGISQWIGETCRGTSSPEQDRVDAAFVAHAREDIPFLLQLLREKDAEITELRSMNRAIEQGLGIPDEPVLPDVEGAAVIA